MSNIINEVPNAVNCVIFFGRNTINFPYCFLNLNSYLGWRQTTKDFVSEHDSTPFIIASNTEATGVQSLAKRLGAEPMNYVEASNNKYLMTKYAAYILSKAVDTLPQQSTLVKFNINSSDPSITYTLDVKFSKDENSPRTTVPVEFTATYLPNLRRFEVVCNYNGFLGKCGTDRLVKGTSGAFYTLPEMLTELNNANFEALKSAVKNTLEDPFFEMPYNL